MNRKPRDPLHPRGFEQTRQLKEQISHEYSKPKKKDDELTPLKKLNHKLGVYLSPKSVDITDDEKKKKIGVIITIFVLITLVSSAYYFLIYEPSQEKLSLAKTTKLNELHELYSGPLTSSPNSYLLEDKINEAQTPQKVENINIMGMATKDWKNYHKKSIYINSDKYNRTMAVYLNESKNTILPAKKAIKIVNENDAEILSKIKFDEPNTVSVPILISRLQAGAGLVNVGSVVDIYTNNNDTTKNYTSNDTSPDISGCTVLAIMRYEDNGEIDSEYSKSNTKVNGNNTNPKENTKAF